MVWLAAAKTGGAKSNAPTTAAARTASRGFGAGVWFECMDFGWEQYIYSILPL